MDRLTFKEPDGTWGVVGMTQENEGEKLYAVAEKLLAYEEMGVDPVQLQGLIGLVAQLGKLLEEYNDLRADLARIQAENMFRRYYRVDGDICSARSCEECPLGVDCDDASPNCDTFVTKHPLEAMAIMEKDIAELGKTVE